MMYFRHMNHSIAFAARILRIFPVLLVVLLAIWMGLFAPLLCQYHGLMWGAGETHPHGSKDGAGDGHAQHTSAKVHHASDHAAHAHHAEVKPAEPATISSPAASQLGGAFHHRAPLNLRAVQSSFMALHNPAPDMLDPVCFPNHYHSMTEGGQFPLQRALVPPDQPPRHDLQSL
jgi:hypothetical protein